MTFGFIGMLLKPSAARARSDSTAASPTTSASRSMSPAIAARSAARSTRVQGHGDEPPDDLRPRSNAASPRLKQIGVPILGARA